jgi:CHAD domain-containing protein
MADESVRAWAHELLTRDLEAFDEARRRFLRRPTGKRLHAVRTSSRRVRSLLEDLSSVIGLHDLDDLRRAIRASGTARDAAVLYKIVNAQLPNEERPFADDFLKDLRTRQRDFSKKTCTRLKRVHLRIE